MNNSKELSPKVSIHKVSDHKQRHNKKFLLQNHKLLVTIICTNPESQLTQLAPHLVLPVSMIFVYQSINMQNKLNELSHYTNKPIDS